MDAVNVPLRLIVAGEIVMAPGVAGAAVQLFTVTAVVLLLAVLVPQALFAVTLIVPVA